MIEVVKVRKEVCVKAKGDRKRLREAVGKIKQVWGERERESTHRERESERESTQRERERKGV